MTRRAALVSGVKWSLLGAFVATVGTTIVSACTAGRTTTGKGGPDPCSHGYGYNCGGGYGNGYGL